MKVKFYICKTCGNVVVKFYDSGAPLSCCGHEMEELKPMTAETMAEKHLPTVECIDKCTLRVKVGAVEHPMDPEHFIRFIFMETANGGQLRYLKPQDKPNVVFASCPDRPVAVYEYCNIHGLWKTEINNELKCVGK